MIDKTVPRLLAGSLPFVALLGIMAALMLSDPSIRRDRVRQTRAENGYADLSGDPDTIHRVSGVWRFAWKSWDLYPSSMLPAAYAPFPGSWAALPGTERTGFASYGLSLTGLDSGRQYAVRIGHTLSACNLLVNGSRLAGAGNPGTSPASEVPGWNSLVAQFFPRADGTADIVLQISNFTDRLGGSNAAVYIGDAALVYSMLDARKLSAAFVSAVLSALGLFFLALFAWRRKEHSFFWFSLLCILLGVRSLCYDDFVLLDLFPALPWPVLFRIGYLTFPLSLVCIAGYLASRFPTLLRRYEALGAAAPFCAYSLVIVFAPERITAQLLPVVQVFGLGFLLWTVFLLVRACIQKLEGAFWTVAAFSAAPVLYVHDLLVSMWVLSGMSLTHFGMVFGLCIIALMGISRYSMSFRKAGAMSAELHMMNRALKRFVPDDFLGLLNSHDPASVRAGDASEVELAVLSAKIGSFPVRVEKMEPEDVFRFLNSFLALVAPLVRANGGVIARYDGDGLVALFSGGSDAALKCAVQLQSAVSARNRTTPGEQPISVSIGIDAGALAVGTLGDNVRLDSAILSDCLRCALRFETASRVFGSRILINGAVFAGLSEPLSWFLRPVDRAESDGMASFLFEVYNNDPDPVRDLKWKTQGDLEHAVIAYFGDEPEAAKQYLNNILKTFSDDPVARHYAQRLQMPETR